MLRRRVWILGVLALLGGHALPASGDDISATMRAEDRRLEKPVTISERRIYLGDLLEQLSKQTGIPIKVDEHDSASGVRVELICKEVPVGDVLNALWSLVSLRDADWTWIRDGKPGAYTYLFFETVKARDRAAYWRAFVEKARENFMATMIEFAFMTPEEREQNKSKISKALLQDDDKVAESLLKSGGILWDRVRLFAQAVPPDMRMRVLRGEERTEIPVSSLPPDAQQQFHEVWTECHIHVTQNGVLLNIPEPDALRFYTDFKASSIKEVVPKIFIAMGQHAGNYGVFPEGDLEDGMIDAIRKQWIMPGDAPDSPSAQNKVAKPDKEDFPIPPGTNPPGKIALRLAQTAQGTPLPLLALLPTQQGMDIDSPYDHTVQDCLNNLRFHPIHPIYKWRGKVLLVNYARWFEDGNLAIPYFIIQSCLRHSDEIIPLPDLVKFVIGCDGHDASEVNELAMGHPALGMALQFGPVFILYKQFPSILSPRGMPLDAKTIAVLRQMPEIAQRLPENATMLRLRQEEQDNADQKILKIEIEVQAGSREWKHLRAFTQSVPRAASRPQK